MVTPVLEEILSPSEDCAWAVSFTEGRVMVGQSSLLHWECVVS